MIWIFFLVQDGIFFVAKINLGIKIIVYFARVYIQTRKIFRLFKDFFYALLN